MARSGRASALDPPSTVLPAAAAAAGSAESDVSGGGDGIGPVSEVEDVGSAGRGGGGDVLLDEPLVGDGDGGGEVAAAAAATQPPSQEELRRQAPHRRSGGERRTRSLSPGSEPAAAIVGGRGTRGGGGDNPFAGEAAAAGRDWPIVEVLWGAVRTGRVAPDVLAATRAVASGEGDGGGGGEDADAGVYTTTALVAAFEADGDARALADALLRAIPAPAPPLCSTDPPPPPLLAWPAPELCVGNRTVVVLGSRSGHVAARLARALRHSTIVAVAWPDAAGATSPAVRQHAMLGALGVRNVVLCEALPREGFLGALRDAAGGGGLGAVLVEDARPIIGDMLPHEFEVLLGALLATAPYTLVPAPLPNMRFFSYWPDAAALVGAAARAASLRVFTRELGASASGASGGVVGGARGSAAASATAGGGGGRAVLAWTVPAAEAATMDALIATNALAEEVRKEAEAAAAAAAAAEAEKAKGAMKKDVKEAAPVVKPKPKGPRVCPPPPPPGPSVRAALLLLLRAAVIVTCMRACVRCRAFRSRRCLRWA